MSIEDAKQELAAQTVGDVAPMLLFGIGFAGLGCLIGVYWFGGVVDGAVAANAAMWQPDATAKLAETYNTLLGASAATAGIGLGGGVYLDANQEADS